MALRCFMAPRKMNPVLIRRTGKEPCHRHKAKGEMEPRTGIEPASFQHEDGYCFLLAHPLDACSRLEIIYCPQTICRMSYDL